MVTWIIIVVSAYFKITVLRIKSRDISEPLIVSIDWHVWALPGISTASLVGTPLINAGSVTRAPDPAQADEPTNAYSQSSYE